ncbi:MAG TPA: heme ABC exporter ATP-binding protein CcmA [Gemmatimonadales bacterium]|nr:heme ABC exporter ATP-binding protein CcmA [Gemmatimonadales bacterium]
MPPEAPLLEARGVTRAFGAQRALRGVDLRLDAGDAVAVAGPNGAGKTTLLRILAGLMRPTAGEVHLADGRTPRDPAARRRVGLLSHQSFLYDDLTARENLRFTGRLYGLPDAAARTERALEEAGLAARADDPVRQLSRGMLQRVAIARALLHDPAILLLDEPFTGLDVPSAARLRGLLADQRAAGRGLVIVTHHLAEAWGFATHVAVLVRGRWARIGPRPDSLEAFLAGYQELVDA